MKNLLLPWFPRFTATAILVLAGSVLSSVAQDYTLGFGRIEVDLTLDPGPIPSSAFTSFFSSAGENVVTGVGGLVDGSVNISGRSPVMGDSYPEICGLASPLFTYPFLNTTPLQAYGTAQPTPTGPYSGHFVMLPGTYQNTYPGTQLPVTPGVIDAGCIPYWVGLRHDLTPTGRKHYYGESFRSDLLLPDIAANGFPGDVRSINDPVGALHVTVSCGAGPLNAQSAFITAILQEPPSISLPDCLPPYPGRPGSAGTVQASLDSAGPGPVDETFLVRAGRSYVVTVLFTSFDEHGPITGQYSSAPTIAVPQGEIVDVEITVDKVFCDKGQGCLSTVGRVGMLGANVFDDCYPPLYAHPERTFRQYSDWQVYSGRRGHPRWVLPTV